MGALRKSAPQPCCLRASGMSFRVRLCLTVQKCIFSLQASNPDCVKHVNRKLRTMRNTKCEQNRLKGQTGRKTPITKRLSGSRHDWRGRGSYAQEASNHAQMDDPGLWKFIDALCTFRRKRTFATSSKNAVIRTLRSPRSTPPIQVFFS